MLRDPGNYVDLSLRAVVYLLLLIRKGKLTKKSSGERGFPNLSTILYPGKLETSHKFSRIENEYGYQNILYFKKCTY